VISQKGGNGKTTLAVHLATLAAEKHKVILMDLDPQGSAIEWASRRGDKAPDITPAHPASSGKEIERAAAGGYTFAVIDTAPHADHSALQAARAADLVVIPCRPRDFRYCGHFRHPRPVQTGKLASHRRYQFSANPQPRGAGGDRRDRGEGR
jgi:chromosome partitioning protein